MRKFLKSARISGIGISLALSIIGVGAAPAVAGVPQSVNTTISGLTEATDRGQTRISQLLPQKQCDPRFFWLVMAKANVRSGPSTDYPKTSSVKKGMCLAANDYSIDSRGVKWIRVTFIDGLSGWISTSNLKGGTHPAGDWRFYSY